MDRYVYINLHQESFIGRIVDCNEQWLVLDNLIEHKSGMKIPGKQNFFRNQIIEIQEIESYDETQRLENLINNAWYIYQMDEKYHKMIEALKTKTVFAMFSENVNFGRNSRMTILNFATEDCVYIWDYINFQKIYKDLKLILEDKSIIKIIHDSARICDYFKYHHKIEINGIFDPLIIENIGYINLGNLIKKHFKVNVDEEQSMNWNIRPLHSLLKYTTAKKTIYLRKLYNCQMLDMIAKIETESVSDGSTSQCSNLSPTSLTSEKSFITANESLYSDMDEFVGEILVIRMEHEILVGECIQNSKYYLKLKDVINPKTGSTLPKQELFKKHMISVDRINNGKRNHKKIEKAKTADWEIPVFKVNRTRPKICIKNKNNKLQEALDDIRGRWLLIFDIQKDFFQILTESKLYIFDITFLELLENNLNTVNAIKIVYDESLKLPGFLDLKCIPNKISLQEFTSKHVESSDELIEEHKILILELYFIFLMRYCLFSSKFLKCEKYSSFFSENDDWAQVSLQMGRRSLPEL